MEDLQARLTRRLATTLVFLALAGGWAANARADIAYGFASQTISAITITPTLGALSSPDVFTQAGATTNGSGPQNSSQTGSVTQAYQGGAPPSPEDNFARYAPGVPVPVSPTNPQDFTRGDARIVNFPTLATTTLSVVAESFINNVVSKSETGSGGLGASFTFVQPTTGALTIGYTFASEAYAWTSPGSLLGTNSSANYQFNFTIRDAAGVVVFNSATANPNSLTNLSLVSPPNGPPVVRGGVEAVVTGALNPGTYSLNFSLTAQSAARTAAVPEPNVVLLVGASGALTFAVGAIRRRTRRNVTA